MKNVFHLKWQKNFDLEMEKFLPFQMGKSFAVGNSKSLVTNWFLLANLPLLKVALFDKFWTISQKQLWKQEK